MNGRLLWFGALAGVGTLAAGAAAELPRAWVKPRPVCGIPGYPYSTVPAVRPTVTVASLVRIPISSLPPVAGAVLPSPGAPLVIPGSPAGRVVETVGPAPGAARPAHVFQLVDTRLQSDHCFLSRVAVTFHEDGTYQVSFRADQNPQPGRDAASPLRPGERGEGDQWTLQTGQLLRNQFVVRVRGYANYQVVTDRLNLAPGKPAVVDLPLDPFWVQRGQPYPGFVAKWSEDVRRYFENVDRVEVEFTYR